MAGGIQVGSAYVALGVEDFGFRAGLRAAENEAHSFSSRVSGSLARIGEIAAGTLIGNVLPRLTTSFAGLARQGLDAVAGYERLGMSLESLVAKELRNQSVVKETISLGQRRVELSAAEREKLQDLTLQRDVLNARMQEETERHRQLVAQWGNEGLAVKTHAANMAVLKDKIDENAGAIGALEGKQGRLIAVTQTSSKMTLSMADALQQAGPKAKELIRWIELLAIKSPFQQEDVAKAFRMAQAYGFVSDSADKNVISAKRLTTAMIDFTSATGATGPTMERVAMALGQIQAKGKLAGGEVLQLTQAGLAVDQILARAMNKSTAEIVALREKGLIPADVAIKAIVESLETDFGGAAARSANTFSGLLSSLADIKSVGLREFFQGTFDAIKPLLDGLVTTLTGDEFMTRLSAIGASVGTFIANTITKLGELRNAFASGGVGGLLGALGVSPEIAALLANAVSGIASLGQVLTGTVIPTLQNLVNMVMPAVASALAFVNQHWEAFRGALAGVAALLAGAAMAGAIAGLAGTLLALANPVTLLVGLAAALGAAWATNFGGLRDKTMEAWAVIGPVFEQLKGAVGAAVGTFQVLRMGGWDTFEALGEAVKVFAAQFGLLDEARSFVAGLQGTWEAFAAVVSPVVEELKTAIGAAIETFLQLQGNGEGVFAALGGAMTTFAESLAVFDDAKAIITSLQEGWNALVEFFAPTIERLQTAFGEMVVSLEPIGGKLQELWQAAEPALSALAAIVGGAVIGAFNLLLEIVAAVMPSVGGIISNAIDAAILLFNLLTTAFQGVVSIFQSLIAGDWNGVWTSALTIFSTFVETLKGLLGLIWDNFSVLFTDLLQAIGNWIGNIDTEAGARFQEFVNNVHSKFTDVYNRVKDGMNRAVDYIRKIDLSEIGRNLITSLADAIWNRAITYLKEKLEGIANILPQWIKDKLGIASPSRVFYEIGLSIIAGLVDGLNEASPAATEALANALKSLMESIGTTMDSLAQLATFEAASDIGVRLQALTRNITETVAAFMPLAEYYANTSEHVSAKAVTDALVPIFENSIQLVTGLNKLAEFEIVTGADEKIVALSRMLQSAVSTLAGLQLPSNMSAVTYNAVLLADIAEALGDIATAWGKMRTLKLEDAEQNASAIANWLASFGGYAAHFVTALNTWQTIDVKTAVVAQVRTAVQLITDIATAWEKIGQFTFSEKIADVQGVEQWLVAFGGYAARFVTALNTWQTIDVKTAVVAQVRTAVQLITDIATAWEKIGQFTFSEKIADVQGVEQWLVAFGGYAARFVTALNTWQTIDVKTAVVAQVRTAVQLITDIATAWEKIGQFAWSETVTDVQGVEQWLVAFGGYAARFVTTLNTWQGIDVKTAVVEQVKAAVQLIADIATAWEKIGQFAWSETVTDVPGAIAWLASFGGLVTVAMLDVSKWEQFKSIGPAFTSLLESLKTVMDAFGATVDFANALGAWKQAKDLPERFLRLRNDFEQIIIYVVQMRAHVGDMVTGDLVKFVRYVGELSDGLIGAVKLMTELANLRRFDITGAVEALADLIRALLDGLDDIISQLSVEKAKKIEAFGTALNSLMQGLKAALDLALAAPKGWVAPSLANAWADFIFWVQGVFTTFYNWLNGTGGWAGRPIPFGADGLNLVKAFGEALGVLMGGLKAALDLALSVPKDWVSPSATSGPWADFIGWVQGVFATFYNWLNSTGGWAGRSIPFSADGLNLVKAFGEALGVLMGGLKAALDLALSVPKDWVSPSATSGPWADFISWVQSVFKSFYDWLNSAGAWAGQPIPFGADGLNLVKAFGEALGVLMGGLKAALDLALAAPKGWVAPSLANAWADFIFWVQGVFTTFYNWLNGTGGWAGRPIPFGADGLNLVKAFGEALGVLMGGLKAALDLAMGLPTTWTAPGAYWGQFTTWVQGVFSAFLTYVQANFPANSAAAEQMPVVKAFGESMTAVFGGLKTAIDIFQGLAGYIPILRARFTDFLNNVTYAYGLVSTYATGAGVQAGTAATTAFAQSVSAVFQALSSALQVFGQLVEGTNATVEVFKTRLQSLISRISLTMTAWKTYVQTEAAGNWTPASQAFVSTLNSVLETLKRGLDLFVALNQAGMPSPNQITAFVNSILALFSQLTAGLAATPNAIDTAGTGINTELSSWPAEWNSLLGGYYTFGQNLAHQLTFAFQQQLGNTSAAGWAGYRAKTAVADLGVMLRTTQEAAYRDVLGATLATRMAEGMTTTLASTATKTALANALSYGPTTGLATWLTTTFTSSFGTTGVLLGSSIASGLADGIRSAASNIRIATAVAAVIDSIKNAIRVAFNIRSPSKVTAGYGEQIAAGLAVGILSGVTRVAKASSALSAAIGPSFSAQVDRDYRLQTERRIVVVFEGAVGGGVPMSPRQFNELKSALAYAIRTGA